MAASNVRGSKKSRKVKDTGARNEKKDFQWTDDEAGVLLHLVTSAIFTWNINPAHSLHAFLRIPRLHAAYTPTFSVGICFGKRIQYQYHNLVLTSEYTLHPQVIYTQ